MARYLLTGLYLALILLGVIIGVINGQMVEIDYLAGSARLPLSAALLLALIFGLLMGAAIIFLGPLFKLRLENRKLKKRLVKQDDPELRSALDSDKGLTHQARTDPP